MSITVAGKEFKTLSDEFYVNGAKVVKAFVNGVQCYPSGTIESIAVTTMPSKLEYEPGDIINFSGIVVTGYDEDGNVVGEIPFNELIFPYPTIPGNIIVNNDSNKLVWHHAGPDGSQEGSITASSGLVVVWIDVGWSFGTQYDYLNFLNPFTLNGGSVVYREDVTTFELGRNFFYLGDFRPENIGYQEAMDRVGFDPNAYIYVDSGGYLVTVMWRRPEDGKYLVASFPVTITDNFSGSVGGDF